MFNEATGKEITVEEYKQFMYNKDNAFNCSECPENRGFDNCSNPCGQQNCWVHCHCNSGN